jgi:hypothetical protein
MDIIGVLSRAYYFFRRPYLKNPFLLVFVSFVNILDRCLTFASTYKKRGFEI